MTRLTLASTTQDPDVHCTFCGDPVRHDSAAGWVHTATGLTRCQLFATPTKGPDVRSLLLSLLLALASIAARAQLPVQAPAQPPAVTTRAYDNARSGANLHETVLTADNVLHRGIRRLTTIPVFGDARGTESQPLILPAVPMKDGSVHDVMVLPSLANVVRGVDAETGAALWQTTLGRPVQVTRAIDFHGINDHFGVLSTGVIDPDTHRVYLVAWISPDGTPARAMHYLCVLNLTDGSLVTPPVSLADLRDGKQTFASTLRKQRSSLVLTSVAGRKTVFFACGSLLESSGGSAGWVLAFDVATNRFTAALALSQSLGAGVWMGGQGLAADAHGFLYAITGNGSFNAVDDFGESFVKIQYAPPTPGTPAWMKVIGWWSPWSDAGRVGENPQLSAPGITLEPKLTGISAPTERAMPVGTGMDISSSATKVVRSTDASGRSTLLVYPATPTDPAWSDEDLGSAGGTLIEPLGVYLGGGKDGILYLVRTADLGNTQPADFADAARNCARLAGPPVWGTYSPGPVSPCPQDETVLDFMPWGKTRHLHATPVQYMSPTRGMTVFVWGENSQLHAWSMSASGALTYLAQGRELASANVGSPGGMPGGFCSLSSNGNRVGTAVLWCSVPYGDANATVTNGRLLAYDPENLVTEPDGSKSLQVLWDSERWGLAYTYNKFLPPLVWNGRVYLPNYAGGVDVYGLGPQ